LKECIVLCGGAGKRLKPEITIPKPFLKIKGNNTLLDIQIEWLLGHGFDKIVLAMDQETYRYMLQHARHILSEDSIVVSLETTRLGTGGAVRKASNHCSSNYVYVLNVDDVVDYDPKDLFDMASLKGGAILVKQPRLPYGKISFDASGNVLKFEEKPLGDIWISVGHYVLQRQIISKYFPEDGDLEVETWQKIANDGKLKVLPLTGMWITMNNAKELEEARKVLAK